MQKVKRKKTGIGVREIILSSLIFSIIGFLGISIFIGQVRNELLITQKTVIEDNNYVESLEKKIEELEDKPKQTLSYHESTEDDIESYCVNILYKDKSFSLRNDIYKNEDSVFSWMNNNYYLSKNNSLSDKISMARQLQTKKYSAEVAYKFLFPETKNRLEDIFSAVEQNSKNASVKFYPNKKKMFRFSPEKNKITINKNNFYTSLLNTLEDMSNSKNNFATLNLSIEETTPKYTVENLTKATELISQFSTSYAGGQKGRIDNIKNSLRLINGTVLNPNESFSFNNTTSPCTEDNGYTKAIIIEDGKFVAGLGGGICQASTTLYNAALLAGLKINHAQNHSLPVHYIDLPFDAMVSECSDMAFTNSTDYPVYIKTYCDDFEASIEIYGEPIKDGIVLKRKSVLVKKIKETEPVFYEDITGEFATKIEDNGGQYVYRSARDGYKYEGYLQYFKDGKLIKEELIRRGTYKPQKAIVYVAQD